MKSPSDSLWNTGEPMQLLQAAFSDRYKIKQRLGAGFFTWVYLAEDVKHYRKVALKVLRPELTAELTADRFLLEIQTAAAMSHPNIVPVYDSGVSNRLYYYVMPFVEGPSLRTYLKEKSVLSVEDSVRIAKEIGNALNYSHKRGIVHQDIKPENILLESGQAVLTDFGIARAISMATDKSMADTDTIFGTPVYMSPEQACGHHNIDHRSDIYSLGCVLFEMLIGNPPFMGNDPQTIIAEMLTKDVPPVRLTRPDVPLHLAKLIRKSLEKNATKRYENIGEFLNALSNHGQMNDTEAKKSIAVLPFVNMSGTTEFEYLADGITEEIISATANIKSLEVVARTSVYVFKGKDMDVRAIGEQLDAQTVLEGSIKKVGERLRVICQLINVENGYHIWTGRYDREMSDVFAIQEEIAQNIARSLQLFMREEQTPRLSREPAMDVHAYEYYLKGHQFLNQTRKKSLIYARDMFTRATEIDPGYALAYAGIAYSCAVLHMFYPQEEDVLVTADETSQKAVELDPDLAEAHTARGITLWQMKNFTQAIEEYELALRLNDQLFEAWYFYARTCFQTGDVARAVTLFENAVAIREDYQAAFFAAQSYAAAGNIPEAEDAYRRALQVIAKYMELNPDDPRAATMRAVALCRLGQPDEGLKWAEKALTIDVEDAGVRYNVACLYALEGFVDKAIDCLEEAIQKGFGNKEWFVHDPDLNSLRDTPRFQRLLE